MLFLEGLYSGRCDQFVEPMVWLTPPHRAVDLALLEASIKETSDAVSILLEHIGGEHAQGAWLDICSGNGIAAIQACWQRGIDLLHIDIKADCLLPLRKGRIAWLLHGDSNEQAYQRATMYLEQNFMTADVEQLAQDPTPILKTMPPDAISGALLLNPDGIPSVLESSVQLAARVLPDGAPLLITTDPSDRDDIRAIRQQLDVLFSSKTEISITEAMHGIIGIK